MSKYLRRASIGRVACVMLRRLAPLGGMTCVSASLRRRGVGSRRQRPRAGAAVCVGGEGERPEVGRVFCFLSCKSALRQAGSVKAGKVRCAKAWGARE
eukprot:6193849-Pleurochrysis_carterae.AAC.2